MEGLPRPSKPTENPMTKSTAEILNSTFGEVEDQSFTYAEALDHYTVVVRQATSVGSAKTQQKKLLDVSTFLVKLHAEFGGNTKLYGACIRKAGFYKPLMKRFGKNAKSEASKMLYIGAVAPTVQKFIEANGKSHFCEATSPTGFVKAYNAWLAKQTQDFDAEGIVMASAISEKARKEALDKLSNPQTKPESPTGSEEPDAVTTPSEPEVEPKAEAPQTPAASEEAPAPSEPTTKSDTPPTAEAVAEQLAGIIGGYGLDQKDIANVLAMLTDKVQPKAAQVVSKGNVKASAKRKPAAKKAAKKAA